MKNYERVLELKKESEDNKYIFKEKIYNWCPQDVKEYFNKIYWEKKGYRDYENEKDLLITLFYEYFVNFLKFTRHWSYDDLIAFCDYKDYARSTALKYIREYKSGDETFEVWLLKEEGTLIETSTCKREKIYMESAVEVPPYGDLQAVMNALKKQNKSLAYLLYLYEEGAEHPTYLKVGKTSNIKERILQLKKQYSLSKIETIKTFDFEDGDTAEMMESFMRKYYKAKYPKDFTPKDRFKYGVCTDNEIAFFEKKALLIEAAAQLI